MIKQKHKESYAPAIYLLGTLYQQGLGVKKDNRTAKDYFNVACLFENKDACEALIKFSKTAAPKYAIHQ